AFESRNLLASVDKAACDGAIGAGCRVVENRRCQAVSIAIGGAAATAAAFHDVPAVVLSLLDNVDLFARALADIAGPQSTGLRVEGEAPGVSHAVCPDFSPRAVRGPCEGVVGRNAVLQVATNA